MKTETMRDAYGYGYVVASVPAGRIAGRRLCS